MPNKILPKVVKQSLKSYLFPLYMNVDPEELKPSLNIIKNIKFSFKCVKLYEV